MQTLTHIRHGFRHLAKSPVFAATAITVLGIGISANAVIFSVVEAFLLRTLPVDQPERLARVIRVHSSGFQSWHFPSELCETFAATSTAFSEVLCQGQLDVALRSGAVPQRVRVHLVPSTFFASLGVGAHIGRTFDSGDERADALTAVLSHQFWQRRFQSEPSVIGRTIALNGNPFVVIGVSASEFSGLTIDTGPDIRVLTSADRWLVQPQDDTSPQDAARGLPAQIFARLRPGQSIEAAEPEAEALIRTAYWEILKRESHRSGTDSEWRSANRFQLEPIARGVSALRTQFQSGLLLLLVGVGLLLVMACANVAGLLLARTVARAPELSVRTALGAGRWQIVRQLLLESLPLALLGGVAGTILTYSCVPTVARAIPPVRDRTAVLQPLAVSVEINFEVLAFTAGIAFLSTLLFGLSPALTGSRVEVMSILRAGRTASRRLSLQKALVVGQVATCTLLLLGAALLSKTLERMRSMDPGFDGDQIVTFTVDPSMLGYESERAHSLAQQLVRETQALPMVSAVGIASRGLMRGTGMKATFGPAGERLGQEDFLNTSTNGVTDGYFQTMGMRVVAGRGFTASDENHTEPRAVIVNEAFGRRILPGQDPVGKQVGMGVAGSIAGPDMQIVGVVTDSRYRSVREEIHPVVFSHMGKSFEYGFILHVRTRHSAPEAAIGPVRNILRSLDPELPFVEVNLLQDEIELSLWQEKLLSTLASVFGVVAALLAAIGLFGALDYAVKTRTREIGIRVALGAEAQDIGRILWSQSLHVLLFGTAIGFAAHAALAGAVRPILYEVHPFDATAVAYALVGVTAICVLATLPPNLRAIRIRPSKALREE